MCLHILSDVHLEGKIPFVVDKMNLARADRATYIGPAKAAGFRIRGYSFDSNLAVALHES